MRNKILIIDDDTDFAEATALLLEANGYEVLLAFSGQAGFQKAKVDPPDLILLDMKMAYETEGAEMARVMSQDASIKNIPLILVTGVKKEMGLPFDLEPKTSALPVSAVMEKPLQPEVLLQTVRSYISESGYSHRKFMVEIKALVEKWRLKEGNLVMILHEIQNHYGYVPRGISLELSRLLDVPLARIYEVITFFNYFKLDPPGKHTISLCMGTACYLKGAPRILDELQSLLGIEEGETTSDGIFQLEAVRCLGCCGLAPVFAIDGKIYGKLTPDEVKKIINTYRENVKIEH